MFRGAEGGTVSIDWPRRKLGAFFQVSRSVQRPIFPQIQNIGNQKELGIAAAPAPQALMLL